MYLACHLNLQCGSLPSQLCIFDALYVCSPKAYGVFEIGDPQFSLERHQKDYCFPLACRDCSELMAA